MMENNDIQLSKKRDFSDIINVTFAFIKQEFKDLFGTIAIYTIIPLLGVGIIGAFYNVDTWSNYFQGMVNNTPNMEPPNVGLLLLMMLFSFFANIMILGFSFEYMYLYHTQGKGNFTRGDVAQAFLKDVLGIIGFNLLLFIVFVFAFAFFIIPGVYLSVPLSLIIIVKIAEKKGFSESWSRCFELVKNKWWYTFGLIIVTYIVVMVLSAITSLPLSIYSGIKGFMAATGGNTDVDYGITTVLSILSTLGSSWLAVILYIMLGSHYYSLSADQGEQSILDRINQIGDRPLEDSM